MNVTGLEFFDDLIDVHNGQLAIKDKYPKLRSLLERACKDLTADENIQFSNLFSRLNYVCDKTKLDKRKTYQINSLRINANKVLHSEFSPTQEEYLQDLKALSNALSHFYEVNIPTELNSILPKTDYFKPKQRQSKKYERIRVEVSSIDHDFIYAFDEENPTEEPIKIKYHIAGINEEFNETVSKLWKGCQLNLISVTVDDNATYFPDFIVVEPDYLLDISSLAENFKDYGSHPLNYLQSKFDTIPNSSAILLGNYANNVFDEFLFATKFDTITVKDVFTKTFKQYPFEFSTCKDLLEVEKETKFKEDVRLQFLNIQKTVSETFNDDSYKIDRLKAIVEPSFICEKLGIQGRLDFLQEDLKNLIELKSGRADDFRPPLKSKQNNYIQMLLYLGVLEFNLGRNHKEVNSYLFYSRYPQLYKEEPAWSFLKKAINIRNLIVCNEYEISTNENISHILINQLTPDELNTKKTTGVLWDRYQCPQINAFKDVFNKANSIESHYFHSFYSFVTKEHLLSKLQMNKFDEERTTSYWLDFESKKEGGEILYDLKIKEGGNKSNESLEPPTITLSIPEYDQDFLPNFRQGDIVILYPKNNPEDNVTNKQIFKGSIQNLTPNEITIRIRYKQRNASVLPITSKYAVEHDFLDSSYNSMYRGLYSFLQANQDRKDLLLNQRQPRQDESNYMENVNESVEIQQVVSKAKIAKDYFLLIGPPGTGKTSIALKSMVEEFFREPSNNILLLSYTNRAVDEMCDALDNIPGNPPFIRIGSELSCQRTHRKRLLDDVIKSCDTRDQVRTKIQEHRIFVGTVSSVSNKTELFKLKTFQVSIIDEASQILEPSLIGVLSAKNATGGNAIEKFILIGDHKQLPAVVLQKEEDSKVQNPELNQIGLFNRRNSLFERLYSLHKANKKSLVWGMLHKQGRMHPDIALFPNYSFYNSKLEPVPTIHQSSSLAYHSFNKDNSFQKLLASKRIAFIPSDKHKSDKTNKTNSYEAKIARELVKNIYELYKANNLKFSEEETVGIITPYRSQIALIKREIHSLEIPELNNISVDTVERFQGSQRDIIIYSFSINQFYQLDFLSNNIEDDGQIIDRKLNVAITRAKKQLFVIGNPSILSNNLTYYRFIEFIRSKAGYVKTKPDDFISGEFSIEEPNTDIEIGNDIYEPDQSFVGTFDNLVIQPLKEHPKTQYPNLIYGYDHDYNRLNVIEYGRTNFDQGTLEHSSMDKVNLYCFYNMRKHYFSSMAIFKSFNDYFKVAFTNSNNRITFIDFGCGPLTSGLAFNQYFSNSPNFYFNYVGIDISNAMLTKAKEFSESELFNRDSKFQFAKSLNDISEDYWESIFTLSNLVVLNFSYLFGNLTKDDAEKLATKVNSLLDKFPLNKYVLVFQNSSLEKRNRTYNIFKKLVARLVSVTQPKTETVVYRNAIMSNFDKSETVYYELLNN
jgi:superfamily I DNA and/or RNA helicase